MSIGRDEFGVVKRNEAIDEKSPLLVKSRITYATSQNMDYTIPVVINNDAGDFLCNFALSHYNSLKLDVSGFTHVPPQGDVDNDVYLKDLKPIVSDIIRQNLR